ncbi:hypothetical protein [Dyella sp. A6]|uniref:hypothetical protein n=1 Tax=Dyella aluminiiresistens TaxID=3069105 RepID=UPI002E795396|nr:hypothetical protein [Dyella sp. A6]
MNRYFSCALAVLLIAVSTGVSAHQKVVDEEQVFAYANAVASGNRTAVRTVFSLNTDGASAEAQDIVLGKLIKVNPKMFLEELQRSQFAGCKLCMPGLLGNLGYDYVDHPAAQLRELRARKAALLTVHNKPLLQLRNKCIAALEQQIKFFTNALGASNSSVR